MNSPKYSKAKIAAMEREMDRDHSKAIVILKCAQTHGFTIETLAGAVSFNHHAWGEDFNTNTIPGQAMQLLIDWQQENHKCLFDAFAKERAKEREEKWAVERAAASFPSAPTTSTPCTESPVV